MKISFGTFTSHIKFLPKGNLIIILVRAWCWMGPLQLLMILLSLNPSNHMKHYLLMIVTILLEDWLTIIHCKVKSEVKLVQK